MRLGGSLALVVLLLFAAACSLDRRRLHLATGGESFREAGGAAGETNPSRSTESGGSDAAAGDTAVGALPDGCADLDTDGVGDCRVTLVENASFTQNVDGWTAHGEAELTWAEKNALEDLPSGSAKLTAEAVRASAEQCVELSGRKLVIAYASAFVEDDAELGQAALQVSFFEKRGCEGELTAYFETPPSTAANRWATIQAGAVSPPGTASVSIALIALEPEAADDVRVYFDNVMLKAKELL